jgi:MULE transposase domain
MIFPTYCEEFKKSNPGITADLEIYSDHLHFWRVLIAFGASVDGLRTSCRLLVGIDGTHLKGKFLGAFMTATTVDGECSLFPLCFAVVDAENRENWTWFMIKLRNLLALELDTRNLTFLSDRQKCLIYAIEEVFPAAPHAHCMQQLAENFRRTFKTPALVPLL